MSYDKPILGLFAYFVLFLMDIMNTFSLNMNFSSKTNKKFRRNFFIYLSRSLIKTVADGPIVSDLRFLGETQMSLEAFQFFFNITYHGGNRF